MKIKQILGTVLTTIAGYFTSLPLPAQEVFFWWGVLIGVDIISALIRETVISTKKEGRFSIKTINSKMGLFGFFIKLMFMAIPFVISVSAKMIGMDPEPFLKTCITFFSLFELYSIVSNFYSTMMRKRLPEADSINLVTPIIGKIRDVIYKIAKNIIKFEDDK